ncbi:hypothetical protein PFICI_09696 [Pestalotiopsis fici W106-1]|uniref:Stress-response A/B barrel domain-containing protein n=1 Tax=Pestalotiopsis fici (strain W106-1 / CGMCC3.15140) TaxID=1229662 RepID=W3WUZ2_PESFW|nr:uncharacterized protein PFICI_09696 [Pestalotiopsis fici W106-1]ETS77634.1 hypothetical protein PFICI_09696 [Pestalotiopsis fici W106-1]
MQFKQLLFTAIGALMASTATAAPTNAAPAIRQTDTQVTHFVSFEFLANQTQSDIDDVITRFLSLKDNCKKPDGSTYILTVSGGTNNSPTDRNGGFTHAWTNTFSSLDDRNYYLFEDPYHLAFEADMVYHLQDAFAFDFLPSTYQTLEELEIEGLD